MCRPRRSLPSRARKIARRRYAAGSKCTSRSLSIQANWWLRSRRCSNAHAPPTDPEFADKSTVAPVGSTTRLSESHSRRNQHDVAPRGPHANHLRRSRDDDGDRGADNRGTAPEPARMGDRTGGAGVPCLGTPRSCVAAKSLRPAGRMAGAAARARRGPAWRQRADEVNHSGNGGRVHPHIRPTIAVSVTGPPTLTVAPTAFCRTTSVNVTLARRKWGELARIPSGDIAIVRVPATARHI